MAKYVYLDEMFTEDEFNDLVIAVESKISNLKLRRERYGFITEDPRFDDPEFQRNVAMMWSERDEARLQRLEDILADLLDASANNVREVEPETQLEDSSVMDSLVVQCDVISYLRHMEEFDVPGAVVMGMDVYDTVVSLLKHFLNEKVSQVEVSRKMSKLMPAAMRADIDKQVSEVEWIIESLDDVLPYLEGAYCINFHAGSGESAGKEET